MPFPKLLHVALFMLAFIYIMTCPVVHEFGDGHVDHDVVNKVQQRIKVNHFKSDFRFIPFSVSNGTQTDNFFQSKVAQKLYIILLSNPTLNLSILSTVRLIL